MREKREIFFVVLENRVVGENLKRVGRRESLKIVRFFVLRGMGFFRGYIVM